MHAELIAFLPAYTDQGNMTRIIYRDATTGAEGKGYDQRQVESVKRALARCYAVDLRAQANLLRSQYCRQLVLHFYLPDGRVFVPFKLRESRIRGDACYGYIDLNQVARLLPGEEPGVILHSGSRLRLCSSISSARLAYFLGIEIISDFSMPFNDKDMDLVHALAVMRGLLASQPPEPKSHPSRRFRIKFLPTF